MITELLNESVIVVGYAVVGLLLMFAGYLMVELVTPGKLNEQLWKQQSPNAAVLVGSSLLGVSIIVVAAIFASADAFLAGLLSTVVYGLVGIILMALSFLVIDLLTPGKLGEVVDRETINPAVWVNAAAHIGVAGIMAAALI